MPLANELLKAIEAHASFPKKSMRTLILQSMSALADDLIHAEYEQADTVDDAETLVKEYMSELDLPDVTSSESEEEEPKVPHLDDEDEVEEDKIEVSGTIELVGILKEADEIEVDDDDFSFLEPESDPDINAEN